MTPLRGTATPTTEQTARGRAVGLEKPEPELSFGWRLTAGSRPGARRPPPKTADLSSDDGTENRLHSTPSTCLEVSASRFAQAPTLSAPCSSARQTLRRRRHRHDDCFCFTRPPSPLRAYCRFVHAFWRALLQGPPKDAACHARGVLPLAQRCSQGILGVGLVGYLASSA